VAGRRLLDVDCYARTAATAWMHAFWNLTNPWAKAVMHAAQQWVSTATTSPEHDENGPASAMILEGLGVEALRLSRTICVGG
jgi:hypothetical protein